MKPLKFLFLILIAFSVTSCNKNQEDATGVGDAIIISKKSGADVVYGYSLYAYTFSSFQSVKAELVNSTIADAGYTLKSNQGYKTNFYYETPIAEFTTARPKASTFRFSAVFENGATDEFLDEVSEKVLALPVIDKTVYNSTDQELEVSWTSVVDANSYAINIFDGTNLVYSSPELANTVKSFPVNSASGWTSGITPVIGKTYKIRLLALLYEPNGDAYNIQAVSMTEKDIIWGN
jgi:hypothetical protein